MNPKKVCFLATIVLSAAAVGSFCPAQTGSSSTAALAGGRATAGSAAALAVLTGAAGSSPTQRDLRCAEAGGIKDPASGEYWVLSRDPLRPEGPGRLVRGPSINRSCGSTVSALQPHSAPIIRAGDPLLVEEHTASADVRLNAIAMSPAAAGDPLSARITPGGSIIEVIAYAPGRAYLAPRKEAKP